MGTFNNLSSYNSNGSTDTVPYLNPSVSSNTGNESVLGINSNLNTGNVAALPQVNYQQQVVAQQNNQAQQQLGNNQIQSLLNQGTRAINSASSSGWFTNNVTNPLNTWGNSSLGFAPSATQAVSQFGGMSGATLEGTTNAATGGFFDATSSASSGISGEVGSGVNWGSSFGSDVASQAAPAWTSATLSQGLGLLGSAGAGYGIGSLMPAITHGNQTGSQIGGTIGAVAGSFLPVPGGTYIGAIIGSTIGGLFGNNTPSDATQLGGIDLGNGHVFSDYTNKFSGTGSEYNQDNSNLRNQAQQGASNLAQWLIANGATPNQSVKDTTSNLVVKVGSRDGYQVYTQSQQNGAVTSGTTTLKNGSNPNQLFDAVSKTLLSQYNLTPALQNEIQNINNGSFYNNDFNLQGAIADPSSLMANGQNGSNNFVTPTIAAQNTNGRGLLAIPQNNPTGTTHA